MEPRQIRPDDFEMIPPGFLEKIMKIESDPRLYNEIISDIEIHEPNLWAWLMASRMNEIVKLSANFPGIVNDHPCLPIYVNGIMLNAFMRGYLAAEAKWRPSIISSNPSGTYEPKEDDFK
jgi:hypothetical protein